MVTLKGGGGSIKNVLWPLYSKSVHRTISYWSVWQAFLKHLGWFTRQHSDRLRSCQANHLSTPVSRYSSLLFLSSVSLSDSEASLLKSVSESDNSSLLGLFECLWPSANRARVSCIKLIDWDTDNMLSLSFNSVDSNKSLAFAEATGIVLRTELFTWSSQRSVSSFSLSNSAFNPALSGLTLSDGWYRLAVTLNSGFGMNLSVPSLVVIYSS